jgi:hypothetical protein
MTQTSAHQQMEVEKMRIFGQGRQCVLIYKNRRFLRTETHWVSLWKSSSLQFVYLQDSGVMLLFTVWIDISARRHDRPSLDVMLPVDSYRKREQRTMHKELKNH